MTKFIFGVDIGGTTVKIGLFTDGGELLSDWEIKTRTENGGINILPDIATAVLDKTKSEHISKEEISGIGLTAPGSVLKDGTIDGVVNMGWDRFNLSKSFSELVGFKVLPGNDANVAALGELWKGGAMGYSDFMIVAFDHRW